MAPVLTNDAPPLDVIENTVWGTEHVIATYKNPGLSYALLELARVITGDFGWPAYVLSQIAVCTTYLLVFLLGRPMLGDERALVGTMLLAACYYFGWHTPEFNQDIVEMPLWAGVCFTLWRATESNRLGYWVGLGAFAAAAVYGKLSAGVLLVAAALWLLTDARARKTIQSPGPWIALLIFALLLAPLIDWLADGGFEAITAYAVRRGREKFNGAQFILLQAAVLLPMVLVAWWAGAFKRPLRLQSSTPDPEFRRFIVFLIWMTAGPILVAIAAVTVMGTGTKFMWGVPMLNLTGLIIVAISSATIDRRVASRVLAAAIALTISNSTSMALTTRFGNQFRNIPDRQNWPQDEISARLRGIWRKETGQQLRIVAGQGQNWVSGLIALSPEGIASVFTSADPELSPWVTPERVAREGALVVWPQSPAVPEELKKIAGGRAPRFETFSLRHPGLVRDVTIGYVVVPPSAK
jgi:4-amino-4-deoxy-L-arabinose transferase-like glycosyltransferase